MCSIIPIISTTVLEIKAVAAGLSPMQRRCKRCGGTLFVDGDELVCLQCGAVRYEVSDAPARAGAGTGKKKRTESWWSIYEVQRFNKAQMKWLLSNLALLKTGIYPPAPDIVIEYGVEAPLVKHREPSQGKVRELAAEVEYCLGLVMDYISGWERPVKKISKRRARK
jgi:hypothetical protein